MKNTYLEQVDTLNLKDETKKLLKEQIELFYTYKNKEQTLPNNEVILSTNNLIHGSRANLKTLEIISKTGLISSEFYEEFNPNKKKPYVIELWDIKEKIKLSDWIKKYAGVTIDFKDKEGKVYKSIISTFEDIKSNIQKEKNFRDYIIYQNQEQRFVPNDIVENDTNIAFIIEYNDNDQLIKNDIFNIEFSSQIIKDILPDWFYVKYLKNRTFDNYETGREKAILFGIPISMIKGILISRKIEQDISCIKKIKELFPYCYICNIDGEIL